MLDDAVRAFDELRDHIGEPRRAVLDKQLDHAEMYRDHRGTPGLTVEQTRAQLDESIRERMW